MSSVRQLMTKTIQDIEKNQGLTTHQSRKLALNQIKNKIADEHATGIDLIKVARSQIESVTKTNDNFGVRGESGSTFLRLMRAFVKEAEIIEAKLKKESDEKGQREEIEAMLQMEAVRNKAAREAQQAFLEKERVRFAQLESDRQELEKQITKFFDKNHPVSKLTDAWKFRLRLMREDQILSTDKGFFNIHKEAILALGLLDNEMIKNYLSIIESPEYIKDEAKNRKAACLTAEAVNKEANEKEEMNRARLIKVGADPEYYCSRGNGM